MIVAICGKAGSGKDTLAKALVVRLDFETLRFADPFKKLCGDVFGWDDEQLYGPSSLREEEDASYADDRAWVLAEEALRANAPEWIDECGLPRDAILDLFRWFDALSREPEPLTPRRALQTIGTECGRRRWGDDVWARALVHRAANRRRVVVPDARFANEVDAVRAAGGKVIRLARPGAGLEGAAAAHVSETAMDSIVDADFDAVIRNAGTKEELLVAGVEIVRGWLR